MLASFDKLRKKTAHATAICELGEFLGSKFEEKQDVEQLIANHWLSADPKTESEFIEFYEKETNYLYFSAYWHGTPSRKRLFSKILQILNLLDVKTVLDFGCGIGSDGLELARQGFKVAFMDVDCPSLKFLKWRLKKRGIEAPVYIAPKQNLPESESVIAIEVLEHLFDSISFLSECSRKSHCLLYTANFSKYAGSKKLLFPMHITIRKREIQEKLRELGWIRVCFNRRFMPSVWVSAKFYVKRLIPNGDYSNIDSQINVRIL